MFKIKPATTVMVSLALVIGACAGSTPSEPQQGLAESGASATESTPTIEGTTTSTTEVTTTRETITVSGVAFASQIEADGRAVDPGVEFIPGVNRLYAVFKADKLPRGLEVNVDQPEEHSYYAFLRPSSDSPLASFGWRWFYQGQLVVEFEPDIRRGLFWLERSDQAEAAIFGGDIAVTGMGSGDYVVEFTTGGNTLFSESFTIAS